MGTVAKKNKGKSKGGLIQGINIGGQVITSGTIYAISGQPAPSSIYLKPGRLPIDEYQPKLDAAMAGLADDMTIISALSQPISHTVMIIFKMDSNELRLAEQNMRHIALAVQEIGTNGYRLRIAAKMENGLTGLTLTISEEKLKALDAWVDIVDWQAVADEYNVASGLKQGMIMAEWISIMAGWQGEPKGKERHWFSVGQIGCLIIEVRFESIRTNDGTFARGDALGYEIWWHEQEYPTYGEGIAIDHPELFPLNDEGLEKAKKAAIEWARQMLTEALEGLPKEGET
jgi:hypothetical protein